MSIGSASSWFLAVLFASCAINQGITTTTTTTTLNISTTTVVPPDERCSPPSLYVSISDDSRGQDCYTLNTTCSNWNKSEESFHFQITDWKYSNYVRIDTWPEVCFFGWTHMLQSEFGIYAANSENPDETAYKEPSHLDLLCLQMCVRIHLMSEFTRLYPTSGGLYLTIGSNYSIDEYIETSLEVYESQVKINDIPLTFEIVEVNDPPRIMYPADIYVKERDPGPEAWNISYRDDDEVEMFPSNYSVTSEDIPEQLTIRENSTVLGNRTVQRFWLHLIKPFDADIYENLQQSGLRNFNLEWSSAFMDEGMEREHFQAKRRRRSRPSKTYENTNKQQMKRIKRQTNLQGYTGPVVNFTLKISDQYGLSTTYQVSVHIDDVNDNEPICTSPGTIAMSRDMSGSQELFQMERVCSDPDFNSANGIIDYRLSNLGECIGAFRIRGLQNEIGIGILLLESPLPKNISTCEFDVVVMDSMYATSTHVKVKYGECAETLDARGSLWNTSKPGIMNYMPCPDGYTGVVSRFCNNYAKYDPAVYECTSEFIRNISNKMEELYRGTGPDNVTLVGTLNELKVAADKNLMAGEMGDIYNALKTATNIVRYEANKESNKTQAFLDVASNMIKEGNKETWESIIYKENRGAETLIKEVDNYVSAVVPSDSDLFTYPQEFIHDNIVLSLGPMSSCSKDINFPGNSTETLPNWITHSDNKVHLQCSSAGSGRYFSSTFYKNISNIIPSRALNKKLRNNTVNSAVISFSLFPDQPKTIEPPIEVTFDVLNKTMKDPVCSYWNQGANGGKGAWATDGCSLKSYTNGIAVCLCDHLTNFAILMSPVDSSEISEADTIALSIISLVGCILSMVCLLLTIIVYIVYWRVIKSERSTIILSLCVTLFLAYLVFLVGVSRTENKAGCTAVAVILHFVYLAVFFLMLVQGINLVLTVIMPLKKQRFGIPMIIAAYGASLLIVAISMGATQLQGYGNKKFCWLSVESGLLWAFLSPVLFVIVANTIIVITVLRGMFGTAAMKKKTDKEKLRMGIRSISILMPVMGITWLFGIFSVNSETVAFQYLFAIFNSIQGVLILIFHCVLNKKIQEAFKKSKAQFLSTDMASSGAEGIPMKTVETSNTLVK